ncbi:MAG: hypothetical protein EBS37_17235 [Betaproteobacteria bacterium]|nr:hypothetical protein [Betaproteobacteria bacterium]
MITRRQIAPLATRYNGVLFKSMLEARWAMYFDLVRVEWRYEDEGYRLPSGPYLPDFWLPDLDMHAEVKPDKGFSLQEITKCHDLFEMTGNAVLLLDGLPRNDHFYLIEPLDAPSRPKDVTLSCIGIDDRGFITEIGSDVDPESLDGDRIGVDYGYAREVAVDMRLLKYDASLANWQSGSRKPLYYGTSWVRQRGRVHGHVLEHYSYPSRIARRTLDGRLVRA